MTRSPRSLLFVMASTRASVVDVCRFGDAPSPTPAMRPADLAPVRIIYRACSAPRCLATNDIGRRPLGRVAAFAAAARPSVVGRSWTVIGDELITHYEAVTAAGVAA